MKLTPKTKEEKIAKFMSLRMKGMSNAQIAKACNCVQNTVWRYIGPQPTFMTNSNRKVGAQRRVLVVKTAAENARIMANADKYITISKQISSKEAKIKALQEEVASLQMQLQEDITMVNDYKKMYH